MNKKVINVTYILAITLIIIAKIIYFHQTINLRSYIYIIILNSLALIFITYAAIVIFKKYNLMLILFDLIISLILFCDNVYYRYFENAISIERVTEIKTLPVVSASVNNIIRPWDAIYFIDLLLVMFIFVYFIKDLKLPEIKLKQKIILCISFLLIGISLNFICENSATSGFNGNDGAYSVLNNRGVLYYHYYDAKRFLNGLLFDTGLQAKGVTSQEIGKIYALLDKRNAENNGNNKYRGACKNKSLIMIQVESLQEFVINTKINGQEITPNLNKLAKESIYFNNIYEQTYMGTTSDAELLANVSIYPDNEKSVYEKYKNNTFYSLSQVFDDNGYSTYAFHGNDGEFWNRESMYQKFGFNKFFNAKDFEAKEILGLGISDKTFFEQSLSKIPKQRPFYSFFVTLSSHDPFKAFENYTFDDNFDTGKYKDTILGNYFNAMHYTDKSIGFFIDKLKENGVYDDSLIVIYGDHKAIQYDYKDLTGDFLNKKFDKSNWITIRKVPLIIHSENIKPEMIATTGGQIDIMPTVLNLLDIKCPYYAFGKNLFNISKGYVVHNVGFVVTDDYYYNWMDGKFYDSATEKIIDGERHKKEVEELQKQPKYSQILLEKNLFKR